MLHITVIVSREKIPEKCEREVIFDMQERGGQKAIAERTIRKRCERKKRVSH